MQSNCIGGFLKDSFANVMLKKLIVSIIESKTELILALGLKMFVLCAVGSQSLSCKFYHAPLCRVEILKPVPIFMGKLQLSWSCLVPLLMTRPGPFWGETRTCFVRTLYVMHSAIPLQNNINSPSARGSYFTSSISVQEQPWVKSECHPECCHDMDEKDKP